MPTVYSFQVPKVFSRPRYWAFKHRIGFWTPMESLLGLVSKGSAFLLFLHLLTSFALSTHSPTMSCWAELSFEQPLAVWACNEKQVYHLLIALQVRDHSPRRKKIWIRNDKFSRVYMCNLEISPHSTSYTLRSQHNLQHSLNWGERRRGEEGKALHLLPVWSLIVLLLNCALIQHPLSPTAFSSLCLLLSGITY